MKTKKLKKGDLVDVWRRRITEKGEGLSYPRFMGTLLEDCPGDTWDVIDIKKYSGEIVSVYSFSIHPWGRG